MKNITFYHSSINEHGHTKNKRTKSDKHNLRFEHNIDNVLNENSKNNLLYINNVKVESTDNENNFNTVQNILNNLKKDFVNSANTNNDNLKLSNTRKTELQTKRTKLKFKIKKWADNEKAEEQEKHFWREIDQKLGEEKLESQPLIDELQSHGKAVKRFNDKRKALSGLEELNALIGTTSRNASLKIISKELLYKIPDKNEVHIKPEHWIQITNAIHKSLYKDFDVIYSTVHTDEQSPHLHARISGKNNTTGEFDIQDQLLNRIRELHPKKLPDKKYCELSAEEVQTFGKLYQTTVFRSLNVALQNFGYDDVKAKKRSEEEKKNDFEKFKDSKKPIADRQFNMQKQLLEKNEELKESNSNLESSNKVLMKNKIELEENNKSLLDNNSDLKTDNNKLIKKKNSNIKKIKSTNEKIYILDKKVNKLQNLITSINNNFNDTFDKVYNFYKSDPFNKFMQLFSNKVRSVNDYKYNEDVHNSLKYYVHSIENSRQETLDEMKKERPDLFEQKLKEEQEKRLMEERQKEELNKRALEEERKHEEEQRNRRSWFSKPTKTSKRKNSRNDSLRRP